MSVISVAVPSAGSYSARHTISGQQWTEVAVPSAGSYVLAPHIGSFEPVINIKSWDPDQDDEEVLHSQSVKANVEALTNTNEKLILYDEGSDFLAGNFNQTEVIGDAVKLSLIRTETDFEDYLSGYALNHASQPEDWYRIDPYASSNIATGDYNIGGNTSRFVRSIQYNNHGGARYEEVPVRRSGIVKARFWCTDVGDNKRHNLFFRTTGSGTGLRGHGIGFDPENEFVAWLRLNDFDSHYVIQSWNRGTPIPVETWFWVKVRYFGATVIQAQVKIWNDGTSEPASWQWTTTTDSTYGDQDGYCGFMLVHSTANEYHYMDDFSHEPEPSEYYTSGDWQSGIIDVSDVDHYSHGLASWDETTPTNTTVAVKARYPGDATWVALTNNAALPQISLGQDMRAGSTRDEIELKIELATTDSTVTPDVENLRVYYEPLRAEEVELLVDGVSTKLSLGNLAWWGRGWIGASGVPPTLEADWSDLWFETYAWWLARDLEVVTATLKYSTVTIESVTFETEWSKYRHGYLRSYYSIPITPFYTGPSVLSYTTLTQWDPNGKVYEWVLTDKGMAIHADAYYIVGHYVLNDQPGSLLAGLPVLNDHLGSLLAEAYKLNDHLGHALVQGWRLDNYPGMVLPAVEYFNDFAGSTVIGVVEVHDHPGSFLLYGVNRDGAIFVNVIDDDTYQALIDMGITFS